MTSGTVSSDLWNRKTFAVVTGASRGIGQAIVENLGEKLAPGSLILLISRDGTSLTSIQQDLQKRNSSIEIEIGISDLSTCNEANLNEIFDNVLSKRKAESFAHALCIHNAGSLGDPSKRCSEHGAMDVCTDYFQLNVASVIVLNSLFLQLFANVSKTVVNISSLCGVVPVSSLSLYCSGKAARDMFFKVLAIEEPNIRVLNYAPGPVETAMRNQILDDTWDSSLCDMFKKGPVLTAETTAKRLMHLLTHDAFKSGDHIDYFDEDPVPEQT